MNRFLAAGLLLTAPVLSSPVLAAAVRPTIVLVHGAFADSSSWNGVIPILEKDGYPVIAAPDNLRGVAADAAVVADVVKAVDGPVILVGHSYAGSVISEAAEGLGNVEGLVYVSAFAPAAGETVLELTGRFPGSTLGAALAPPVTLDDGGADLYIRQASFPEQFAADLPIATARLMAVEQRPIARAALSEPSTTPAWAHIPSWFISGDADRNIPPAAIAFMAERAQSRHTVVVKGASHVVMVSHPDAVAALIEEAAGVE